MNTHEGEDKAHRLAELLRQTAEAHFGYEQGVLGGVRDEHWASWYATYMRNNGLPEMLGDLPGAGDVTGNLETLLSSADERYQADSPAEDWPSYYGVYLVQVASSNSDATAG